MRKYLSVALILMMTFTLTFGTLAAASAATLGSKSTHYTFYTSDDTVYNLLVKIFGKYTNVKIVLKGKQPAPVPAPQPTPNPTPNPEPAPSPEQPAPSASEFDKRVVELVNQERAKAGLPVLKMAADLNRVAQIKVDDMAKNKYFAHESPTLGSPFDLMKREGIQYTYAGENIAAGQRTPEEVMQSWMNSPGHRANILNPNYTEIGIAHARAYAPYSGGYLWAQEFINRR